MTSIDYTLVTGARVHLIGIGGIGMSGLAQMLLDAGCTVSGSDRGYGNPENQRIFSPLLNQGITIYGQDGSFPIDQTDVIVYSTAIEDDNPDFLAAPLLPRLHRSQVLDQCLNLFPTRSVIAVTGSCGKTTVSSWLAESLFNADIDASVLSGGLINRFIADNATGNYHSGASDYLVFEADESDKSLLNYSPDYSIVLNIGTDHYSKEELIEVFQQFLRQTKKGAVISNEVLNEIGEECVKHLNVITFSTEDKNADWKLTSYEATPDSISATLTKQESFQQSLPASGIHTAANALAIHAAFDLIGITTNPDAVKNFNGVWRRMDLHGTLNEAKVYDDYAHNVEKIVSSMQAARETTAGKLIVLFQPHGFGPLKFMREELFSQLESTLEAEDIFALMPVFYAGGTASFSPTSKDVIAEYQRQNTKNYQSFENREEANAFLAQYANPDDTIIIMGARDNSLSDWASELGS